VNLKEAIEVRKVRRIMNNWTKVVLYRAMMLEWIKGNILVIRQRC